MLFAYLLPSEEGVLGASFQAQLFPPHILLDFTPPGRVLGNPLSAPSFYTCGLT